MPIVSQLQTPDHVAGGSKRPEHSGFGGQEYLAVNQTIHSK